jgi:hypothetical protein
MARKILILGVVLMMCLGLFTGCGGNKYNAELHYNAQAMMNAEYLEANMTLGAYDGLVEDTSSPETRTHIIKNKNDFDFAFNEFPKEVDFSKKMVLIYFFTSSYPTSPYKLEKTTMDSDILRVYFKLNKSDSQGPDASKPQQTCVVVLIDILDISNVSFKQV